MSETTSQRRAGEDREGRAPRQPKRKRDALLTERSASGVMSFEAVAAATIAIPPKERPKARDEWLRAARSASISNLAKLAAHEFDSALYWKKGYAEISTSDLAERIGCTRRGATGAIDELRGAGLIVRRIDKRGKENNTAKTALPGLVEAHRQACEKAGSEVGNKSAPPREPAFPAGREPGRPDVGNGSARSQSPVKAPEKNPTVESFGAHARVTDLDFSNPGDRELTVPAEAAQPTNSPMVLAESKMGSAVMPVERARPHKEPTAPVEGEKGLVLAAGLPIEYPFTDSRPDITYLILAQGIEPQMVWDRFIAKNLQRLAKGKEPINIKGTLPLERVANLGQYLVAMAREMAAQRYRKEANSDVLAEYRASRGPAWKPSGSSLPPNAKPHKQSRW